MNERSYYVATAPFEAARRVDILPKGHPSRRLHGHSFLARVRAELADSWAPFRGDEVAALKSVLEACVRPLDYNELNTQLQIPTDENLARWVRGNLNISGVNSVGVQSTQHQGADLDGNEHLHIWRRFRFEAAHQLPNVRAGHPCGRMHGHGFEVILHADQELDQRDMGVDFDHLNEIWMPIQNELNYACLNDILGLENPTSEILSRWLWSRIKSILPELSWVTVYETDTAGCHYDGQQYRIWKEQKFESALQLVRAPEGNPRRRLHGHSYLIRLHLTALLDDVMGWTVDYGDVKELFKPVYEQLDHHLLNKLPGIQDTDPTSVVKWIRNQMKGQLPQLDRIDLYETPGCGVQLCWGEQGPALPT
jgi:6-pyruvoyltetrahydropterin/6-carboxytetrahydropterin synthase